jgi:two-component system chemotaxis response regulator CheB
MPMPRPARILIVDDSAVMRGLLRSVVIADQRLEVAGTASDGVSALRAMDSVQPDLVLLDVEMPMMDGLSTLKQMKANGKRLPVIMCSTLTQRGAKVTIEALACGASDYVAKPSGHATKEAAMRALSQDLIPKILALTAYATSAQDFAPAHSAIFSAVRTPGQVFPTPAPSGQSSAWPSAWPHTAGPGNAGQARLPIGNSQASSLPLQQPASKSPPTVLLIGVSTGGPAALDVLLPALPSNFSLPVLVVQHMPELFTKLLAERLNGRCPLRVSEATAGEPVRPGAIYIARGDWHMEVTAQERMAGSFPPPVPVLRLTQETPENHCRPAADVLFRTSAQVYGSGVLAVVLTGMGSDGLAGCRIIRQHGGTVLAQDQSTSAVWGMPGAVAQAGLAHRVLPLNAIAPEILRLASRGQREAYELRESAV